MKPWLLAAALALAPAGCNFDSSGGGTAGPALPGDNDDTGGATTTTGSAETTVTPPASTGSTTTQPPADTTADTGPPAETDDPVGPVLTVSDPDGYDFGPRDIDSENTREFMVTNEGDQEAAGLTFALSEPGVDAPGFAIIANECGDTLGAGQSCTVTAEFAPDLFGPHAGTLEIEYEGLAGATEMISREMIGVGIGLTGNLVTNGGGEDGATNEAPPGWTLTAGNWVTSMGVTIVPNSGAHFIWPGNGIPGLSEYSMFQQIPVAGLTTWGDAEDVLFHVSIWARSFDPGNDPMRFTVRFQDGGGANVGEFSSPDFSTPMWTELVGMFEAPRSTGLVQLVLSCSQVSGLSCSAFFDDIEIRAEYQG
ncbi:MAG: choice-of-anchor D domain-containing protein [Deltaproteobacteria bacterium]|nr:choice-of-anchor D domain-containing protein [Deltaproteobacteria bacterium]